MLSRAIWNVGWEILDFMQIKSYYNLKGRKRIVKKNKIALATKLLESISKRSIAQSFGLNHSQKKMSQLWQDLERVNWTMWQNKSLVISLANSQLVTISLSRYFFHFEKGCTRNSSTQTTASWTNHSNRLCSCKKLYFPADRISPVYPNSYTVNEHNLQRILSNINKDIGPSSLEILSYLRPDSEMA